MWAWRRQWLSINLWVSDNAMKKSLIALALGTFALGIAEFTMMGILGDVARSLDVSIPRAGHLISAYSAGVAVGAPGLIFLRRLRLDRLMLLLAAVIAVGNALVALSPGFGTMLAARFVAGLPHGAFFGAGAIVCTRLSPGAGASAVAVMVGGMTVANVVGVPMATFVSGILSWRVAFGIVAVCGALACLAIRIWVPEVSPLPDTGIRGQFRFLRTLAPWLIFGGVFFGQASVYCWFSYLEPSMTHLAGYTMASMTWIMVVAGCGMVVGNALAGRLADRHAPSLVSAWIGVLIILVMTAIYFLASSKVLSVALMFVATGCLFGIGGPAQFLIVRFAKGGEMLGGAGIQIAFNVSNALAAFMGGAAIRSGMGWEGPALVGLPFAAVGATAFFVLHHKYKSQGA